MMPTYTFEYSKVKTKKSTFANNSSTKYHSDSFSCLICPLGVFSSRLHWPQVFEIFQTLRYFQIIRTPMQISNFESP